MSQVSNIIYRGLLASQSIDIICNNIYNGTGSIISRHEVIQEAKEILGLGNDHLVEIHGQLISKGVSFFDLVFLGLHRIEAIRKHSPEITSDIDGFIYRLFQGPDQDFFDHALEVLKRHKYDLIAKYSRDQIVDMVDTVDGYIDWLYESHSTIQGLFRGYLTDQIDLVQLEDGLNVLFKELESVWFSKLEHSFSL